MLALLQEGQHPLELLGISHLLPRLQQQLSAMLGALHRTFSPYTTYGAEGVPKDKAPQVGQQHVACDRASTRVMLLPAAPSVLESAHQPSSMLPHMPCASCLAGVQEVLPPPG